jgi:hypothetical protein
MARSPGVGADKPRAGARTGATGCTRDPIALRPHDPQTGEEIERDQVVKGYEYERGQFVTFRPDELKALDIESSKTIDLTTFVPRRRSIPSISMCSITSIQTAGLPRGPIGSSAPQWRNPVWPASVG